MKGPRLVFLAVYCGVVSAQGCTQIAGLGGDYRHVTSGGSGALGGAAGVGGSHAGGGGTSAGTTGDSGAGGDAGGVGNDGGTGGGGAGRGGTSAGAGGSVAGKGTGGDSVGLGGQGGEPSGAGGSAGNGASAGMSGTAGTGGSWAGPIRIGYSMFSDSASGDEHANGHLVDASFEKPAGTQEGDLMLAFFGVDHQLYIDDSALMGWTLLIAEEARGTDGQGTYLMYKLAGADEPDPIVFEGVNPQLFGLQALLSVYRGVNPTSPVNVYDVAGTDDLGAEGLTRVVTPTPAVTTTVANCLLLAGLSPDSVIESPIVASWPDGFTNELSVKNPKLPFPNGWANIYFAERTWEAPATFPESSIAWDIGVGDRYDGAVSFMLALAPEP